LRVLKVNGSYVAISVYMNAAKLIPTIIPGLSADRTVSFAYKRANYFKYMWIWISG